MCDDVTATVATLRSKGVTVKGEPEDEGWGVHVTLELPGGVTVLLYQPRHLTAIEAP